MSGGVLSCHWFSVEVLLFQHMRCDSIAFDDCTMHLYYFFNCVVGMTLSTGRGNYQ